MSQRRKLVNRYCATNSDINPTAMWMTCIAAEGLTLMKHDDGRKEICTQRHKAAESWNKRDDWLDFTIRLELEVASS